MEKSAYLDEVGAAQRDDLHDALALRERDGGAVLARALQVLPPGLHPFGYARRRGQNDYGEDTLQFAADGGGGGVEEFRLGKRRRSREQSYCWA
jgi:hypothetical protein